MDIGEVVAIGCWSRGGCLMDVGHVVAVKWMLVTRWQSGGCWSRGGSLVDVGYVVAV